ncbi:MAG: hypothetical protein WBM44_05070 [Waterburya sp.]
MGFRPCEPSIPVLRSSEYLRVVDSRGFCRQKYRVQKEVNLYKEDYLSQPYKDNDGLLVMMGNSVPCELSIFKVCQSLILAKTSFGGDRSP